MSYSNGKTFNNDEMKDLQLLSQSYSNINRASSEIVNLKQF